ncbi:ABC transporter permease [Sulfurirhabdus autotrophica]|uniref:Putative ABC transport system permease protein n=1 Tax=Sulfurirhabdus autotrophica TaxID=1706046 RepID=A0A4R3YEU2_9PROT|nr:FtsX-like permease family protein [Sulfurirhabdus autotrophica]TCV90697.1 putative ABC transport system permease protein [Sulfurirhabdus autotrophica]
MNTIKLSLRFLLREWRVGELNVLLLAVIIAVASVTTVGFFTDRVQQVLSRQANQLLGADLIIASDHPIRTEFSVQAISSGLKVASFVLFPSMVLNQEASQLAEIKAVSPGYPLRGKLKAGSQLYAAGVAVNEGPKKGNVWAEPRLLTQLGLQTGDKIELGGLSLTVSAVLTQEPDRSGDFFSIAPRLMMNLDDLAKTGLIQPGSRANYRLLIAGDALAVEKYRAWAEQHIARGEKLEGVQDARPEIRAALERAQKYLGLASLVSVVLAAVAVAVASRRFMRRHLDGCAVMRCVGASQSLIFKLNFYQFLWLGIAASLIGSLFGYLAQTVLAHWLSSVVPGELPQPTLFPVAEGVLTGLVLLLAFSLPPLLQLRKVPTLRVLRRELGAPEYSSLASYGLGLMAVGGLLIWKAGDVTLGVYAFAGLAMAMILAALLTWGLILGITKLRKYAGSSWFYGLANVSRRGIGSVAQVVAFGLGMTALLLLTLVRSDLMTSWQTTLPPEAPNRFVINIQPDQIIPMQQFFKSARVSVPQILPMVRGRLVSINGKKISVAAFPDDRARRLVEREFNLSWSDQLQTDNKVVAGRWWQASDKGKALLSVEEGIAKTLGIQLGDELTYDVAGSRITAKVSNLRKVNWDSFNVNFFVVAPSGLLNDSPASYITSFYWPESDGILLNQMVKRFPNFTVIDVAAVMTQVRSIMERVASAVEFVFLFTLLAGLMVLYAAISATQDERIFENAVMRTLGASRRQLLAAQLTEFVSIGVLSGFVAALGASGASYVLSTRILNLPFHFNPWIWVAGIVLGGVGIAFAGWLGIRKTLNQPPLLTIRSAING